MIYCDGCADRWKNETYRKQVFQQEHEGRTAKLGHSSEGLGDNAENQPRQLREQIQLGRSKIKQTEVQTPSVKQNHEYHLSVKIVKRT